MAPEHILRGHVTLRIHPRASMVRLVAGDEEGMGECFSISERLFFVCVE